MIKIAIDIFMYLFEGMLIFYYSNSLFPLKRKRYIQLVLIAAGTFLLLAVYQLNITYLNAVLIFTMNFYLFKFLYKISFRTAAFHSFVFLAVMFAAEILVMALYSIVVGDFNASESDIMAYFLLVATSKLIYFTIMAVILKWFATKEDNGSNNKYFWLLLVTPLTSVMILLCLRYITYQTQLTQKMSILLAASCTATLFANILVFIIYEFSLKNTKELYELKTIQHQEEQDKRYLEIIEQSNKDMRIFSHDIKNHLMQIRNLETIEDVQNYIDDIYPNVEKFSFMGISKNKMLDLIISKYATLCASKTIKFSVDVKTANLSYVRDADLSILMNNLLDNAVEAAEKSEEGFVQVRIFAKSNMHDGLMIKNSCIVSPKTENDELKTTKRNQKLHGLGTKSIKKTLKKYEAIYGWKYDETAKIFETDIVFPKMMNCDGKVH